MLSKIDTAVATLLVAISASSVLALIQPATDPLPFPTICYDGIIVVDGVPYPYPSSICPAGEECAVDVDIDDDTGEVTVTPICLPAAE